jgi:hypothetical protein
MKKVLMRKCVFIGLALFGCTQELEPLEDLTLEILSPQYGEFIGNAPVTVSGRVSDPAAMVRVEGEVTRVGPDGAFEVVLPIASAYRNIDIFATRELDLVREHIPVFAGEDPMDSWPSAMTARITPDGFMRMGQALGLAIDATNWDQQLLSAIPSLDTGGLFIGVTDLVHEPTEVVLRPVDGGIDVGISMKQVEFQLEAEFELFGSVTTVPVSVGYELIELGAKATPSIDADGIITLEMSDTFIIFDEPIIEALGFDLDFLDFLLDGINSVLEPVGEFLLDTVFDLLGVLELGGPIDIGADLMGTPLNIKLAEVYGEVEGMGLGLGVGLGADAPSAPLPMWSPVESGLVGEETHLLLALHEGLIQGMIDGQLLDLLGSGFDLPPAMGGMMGTAIQALPGGETAPNADAWCLDIDPGTAKVYRHREGIEPMGALYLPDMKVGIGPDNGAGCETWLTTSLALEVGLKISDGTKINIDISIPEGAVLEYASTGTWSEDEVVASLGSLVETMMGLLGGSLSFDLAELLGDLGSDDSLLSLVGEINPQIIWNEAAVINKGDVPTGTYMLSMSLWDVE